MQRYYFILYEEVPETGQIGQQIQDWASPISSPRFPLGPALWGGVKRTSVNTLRSIFLIFSRCPPRIPPPSPIRGAHSTIFAFVVVVYIPIPHLTFHTIAQHLKEGRWRREKGGRRKDRGERREDRGARREKRREEGGGRRRGEEKGEGGGGRG